MKWKIIPIIILTSLLFVACSDDTSTTTDDANNSESLDMTTTESTKTLELTLDKLSEFDGINGNPAYIAVDGKIYDVSDVPVWSGGDHNGFTAGKDGRAGYIAYDGYVYDVSTLSMWSNGYHKGIVAWFDVTDDLQDAPHGDEMLENTTIIGILE